MKIRRFFRIRGDAGLPRCTVRAGRESSVRLLVDGEEGESLAVSPTALDGLHLFDVPLEAGEASFVLEERP